MLTAGVAAALPLRFQVSTVGGKGRVLWKRKDVDYFVFLTSAAEIT